VGVAVFVQTVISKLGKVIKDAGIKEIIAISVIDFVFTRQTASGVK
jgi:hypothetical protein